MYNLRVFLIARDNTTLGIESNLLNIIPFPFPKIHITLLLLAPLLDGYYGYISAYICTTAYIVKGTRINNIFRKMCVVLVIHI